MRITRAVAGGVAAATAVAVLTLASPSSALARPTARPSTGHAGTKFSGGKVTPLTEIPDPPANVTPSAAFWAACYPSPNADCDSAAVADFDTARALEGLGPMTLPTDFDSLSVAQQLFVLANIDRVDRGLIPVAAMSAPINALALTGAQHDTDPAFPNPFYGNYGGSNWAGAGTSSFFPEFLWVYDDGLGSGNEDCTHSNTSGCWGHRHNILEEANYHAPLLMGAAEVPDPTYGGSSAEEFISGDHKDSALDPQWSAIQALFPVGLSTTSVALTTASEQTVPVTAWASGEGMDVTAEITSGARAWSVSPTACTLPAGTECTLDVLWNPHGGSATSGTLTVTGPNGVQQVSLSAPGPGHFDSLSASAAPSTVTGGASTTLSGVLTDTETAQPLAGREVTVQTQPAGQLTWATQQTVATAASGSVSVTERPQVDTTYRLVAASADGYAAVTSKAVTVAVQPVLTVTGHARAAAHSTVDLTVASTPKPGGQQVTLQRRRHGVWDTVSNAHLSAAGRHTFAVQVGKAGVEKYRVIEAATSQHAAASSRAFVIAVH